MNEDGTSFMLNYSFHFLELCIGWHWDIVKFVRNELVAELKVSGEFVRQVVKLSFWCSEIFYGIFVHSNKLIIMFGINHDDIFWLQTQNKMNR